MATLQRESDVAATREAVVAGLSAYNAARVGPRNSEPVALSLRDDHGVIVGGLIGELKWEWLHIDRRGPSRRRPWRGAGRTG